MPGYEPRALQAMALGLAVNARGADHNRSGAYEADSPDHDRLNGGPAHVAAAIDTEDRAAVMDSMILCKFLRGSLHRPVRRMCRAGVTGHRLGRDRPSCARARRIVTAKQVFNLREGATAADDTLPRSGSWSAAGTRLRARRGVTEDRLMDMVSGYYAARGWNAEGRPGRDDTPGCGSVICRPRVFTAVVTTVDNR